MTKVAEFPWQVVFREALQQRVAELEDILKGKDQEIKERKLEIVTLYRNKPKTLALEEQQSTFFLSHVLDKNIFLFLTAVSGTSECAFKGSNASNKKTILIRSRELCLGPSFCFEFHWHCPALTFFGMWLRFTMFGGWNKASIHCQKGDTCERHDEEIANHKLQNGMVDCKHFGGVCFHAD